MENSAETFFTKSELDFFTVKQTQSSIVSGCYQTFYPVTAENGETLEFFIPESSGENKNIKNN